MASVYQPRQSEGNRGRWCWPFVCRDAPTPAQGEGSMSGYPSWVLICAILGCLGAVILLAWNTAQEQRAGRFDSLIARVNRAQSLGLFRAVAIARWTCISVLAAVIFDLIRLLTFDHI